jgi:soluble lytic murein transglycosylase-like protein
MRDDGALVLIVAVAAIYLLARNAQPGGDVQEVQTDQAPPIDILDARDAWIANGGAPEVTESDAQGPGVAADPLQWDAEPQYDAMGNVISAGWWGNLVDRWSQSKIPAQYAATIAGAEAQFGLPSNMLARLLWQESRYRADIINGSTQSSVGALGIAQFMPATAADLGIDPLNPAQAIPAAARYLRNLYNSTGTWAKALAAYNWGVGNVQRKGLDRAPIETQNYYKQILADIGMNAAVA